MEYLPEDLSEKLATALYQQAVASFTCTLNKYTVMKDVLKLSSCNNNLKNIHKDIENIMKA
ncbi:MAG TPA: hypothetical protein PLP33_24805 [Leptospiraceae bacterium]|nr:hypothetical protein [Leptospiraceae bacterium]